MVNLKIRVCTWNVAGTDPLNEVDIKTLFGWQQDSLCDVYVVGLQEIPTGAVETAISFISHDPWAKEFMEFFSKHGFYLVESVRLQGMSLCLFAYLDHLPFIRFVRSSYERTGFSGNWGNKGGVAVSVWLYGEKVSFLNTHLHANLEVCAKRVEDFEQIIRGIDFNETADLLSHDVVVWLGDTNFRIDDIDRSEVIKLVGEGKLAEVMKKDQLKMMQKKHELLAEFVEGEIDFPPTYKFDPGTDTYDTSAKQRKPAWTDRVLIRAHPDVSVRQLQVCQKSTKYFDYTEGSYKSVVELKMSDHRPVCSDFDARFTNHVSPLVGVKISDTTEDRVDIEVTFEPGVLVDPTDYLALYNGQFTDFRSYTSWVYISGVKGNPRVQRTVTCNLPIPESNVIKEYRVGYYSTKMSCLLCISKVFKNKITDVYKTIGTQQ